MSQHISRFDQRLSFLIHRLNARLAQVAARLFRTHDLDPIRSRILVLVLEQAEMRVGELVEAMVLPQSTVSHQLQKLDAAGLIHRRRTRPDNRSVVVTLTETGRRVAAECNQLSLVVYDRMIANLTSAEIAALQALLLRMFTTLDDVEEPTDLEPAPPARL